jgi:hypothetical protein
MTKFQGLFNQPPLKSKQALTLRLVAGALIGFSICLLFLNFNFPPLGDDLQAKKASLLRDSLAFSLFITTFVIWAGAGTMRRYTHLTWCLLIATVLFCLSYSIAAQIILLSNDDLYLRPIHFWAFPMIFIANELVISADRSYKWIAAYETYFEEAWKRGIQLLLALLFVGLFWIILFLGIALFKIIKIEWFGDVIAYSYVAWVISGVAMGFAVHLADVQTKMLSTVRLLVLTVLSWLLPLITLIGLGFGVGLIFTGLKPLWDTNAATLTMLSACVILVLLMNSAYQQGEPDRDIHPFLKWTLRLASVVLLAFSLIAAYSLILRVNQYGLTFDRILAGLGVFVSVLFGIGYTASIIVPSRRFMQGLETTNITMAFVKVALILALLTPVLDPNRLSVESQVARLKTAKVTQDQFDWWFLRFGAEKQGITALDKLSNDPVFGDKAREVKSWKPEDRWENKNKINHTLYKIDPNKLKLVTGSDPIPQSFLNNGPSILQNDILEICSTKPIDPKQKPQNCLVKIMDLNLDQKPEVIISVGSTFVAFEESNSSWRQIANYYVETNDSLIKSFESGRIQSVRPVYNDILVGDQRIQIIQLRPIATESNSNQVSE